MKAPDLFPHSIFRANDIRGKVETELTPQIVYLIGRAFGSAIRRSNFQSVVIAQDGRLTSPSLFDALSKGILDCGVDVVDIGRAPTPLMYFATRSLEIKCGAMITGSHNPPDENGLKLILNDQVLTENQLATLYEMVISRDFLDGQGCLSQVDVRKSYFDAILKSVRLKKTARVVVDCGNGIVGAWFPDLARMLGCEVIESCCDVDGRFPNHFPDPSVPENLIPLVQKVKETCADLGVAFDGDGDRLGVVTNEGRIVWPDRLLMLFAQSLLENEPKAKVIYDVKCSSLLCSWISERGGNPIMWKTGHSLIKAKLKEESAFLAGEMSGHFYFNDRWYGFDDALYAACRLLEILSSTDQTIEDIFSSMPDTVNTPEMRVPMADSKKFEFMEQFAQSAQFDDGIWTRIDGVRVDFPFGFGLVRASNTSPYLILRFEADTSANLSEIQNRFRKQLLAVDPLLDISF